MLQDAGAFFESLAGYVRIQGARPQTIGYALADSPVGLAAWIYDLFQETSGMRGDAEASFTRDELLDNIMIYWLTNTGASSARLYWELGQSKWSWPASPAQPMTTPSGFSMFGRDHLRKSRRWLEQRYATLAFFAEHAKGGHFAALERPDALAHDIRATFAAIGV